MKGVIAPPVQATMAVKKKETAPERKKAAAKVSDAQYKIKQDERKKKYAKAVDMVRYKQIGGDDGYQDRKSVV